MSKKITAIKKLPIITVVMAIIIMILVLLKVAIMTAIISVFQASWVLGGDARGAFTFAVRRSLQISTLGA